MNKAALKKELDDALECFKADIQSEYSECSKEPATEGDIAELAKHTFYALDRFEKALLTLVD